MKLFNSLSLVSLSIVLAVLVSSCSTSDNITSNSFITKRKYRKGFNLQLPNMAAKKITADTLKLASSHSKKKIEAQQNFVVQNSIISSDTIQKNEYHSSIVKQDKNLHASANEVKFLKNKYNQIKAEFIRNNFTSHQSTAALPRESEDGSGWNIASFVCAIVGLLVVGLILGTLAIIFGVIGSSKKLKGLGMAGVIIGAIDIIAMLILLSLL